MTAQSDPLGHLHEEMCILNNKIDQLESNITKKVTDDIQSSVPLIVTNSLKENLSGLLSKALKNTLPQLIKDPIQQSFNAFNTLESRRFVILQQELSKVIKTKLGVSVKNKDLRSMYKDMVFLLEAAEGEIQSGVDIIANAQGEQPPAQELMNVEQAHLVNEESALVLHVLVEKSSEENTSEKIVSDDEPLTTSSIFSPSPPREPTLSRDESKGKGIATEEPLKDIMSWKKEVKEMKRLADLKAEKEKSEKSLQKASQMIYYLKAKFEWVLTQAKKLGVPLLPELSTFGISVDDKKRKRSLEILQEVFVKENIVVDGRHWNIIPPLGVEGRKGLVIREPESGIFYYNGNFKLAFQREEEFHLATTAQLIRLHDSIQRGTLEAEEIFEKIGLTIEARDDVD
ncbi:hypothetical protein Tco_0526381 [Tanacetum coccineum]